MEQNEYERLIEYSEMTSFNFKSEEYLKAKEDFKTCKNFVKGLGWLLKFLLGKLKAGVVVD